MSNQRILPILLLTAAVGVAAWCWHTAKMSPRLRAIWNLHQLTGYKDFTINGQIVQEDGTPLSGVTIEVLTSRLKKAGTDSHSESEYLKPTSSDFQITRKGYSSVYLYFHRDGFEYQSKGFTQGGVYDGVRIVLRRKTVPPPTTAPETARAGSKAEANAPAPTLPTPRLPSSYGPATRRSPTTRNRRVE